MKRKFIIKSIIFATIFCIITPLLGRFLLSEKNSTLDGFYYEEKDTMDVLFFGSSHMYCTANPNVIWEKAGIPSYNLGQPEQPIWITYHYIKEALKYQKPKVIFLDVLGVNLQEEYKKMSNSNISLDTMKMSKNKLEAIKASVARNERPYFLFDLLKNKSSWKNISQKNFIDNFKHEKNENKGYLELYEVYENEKPIQFETEETLMLTPKGEEYLRKIIDLSKQEGITLVLMKSPYSMSEDERKRYNRVAEIADENNIEFIDFNQLYDEIDINFKTDMLDKGSHVNLRGARKISTYISEYLQTNFNLENKKDNKKYTNWNLDSQIWNRKEKAYELSQQKEIKLYFDKINDPNYTVIETYNDDENTYYKVFNGTNKINEGNGDNNLKLNTNIEDINVYIKFDGGKSSIIINEEEHCKYGKGLNIVVYDNVLKKVVDTSNIDISNNNIVR